MTKGQINTHLANWPDGRPKINGLFLLILMIQENPERVPWILKKRMVCRLRGIEIEIRMWYMLWSRDSTKIRRTKNRARGSRKKLVQTFVEWAVCDVWLRVENEGCDSNSRISMQIRSTQRSNGPWVGSTGDRPPVASRDGREDDPHDGGAGDPAAAGKISQEFSCHYNQNFQLRIHA